QNAHFDSLEEKHFAMLDVPSTVWSHRSTSGVHTVQALGQPEARTLETEFERIVDAVRWVGNDEERSHDSMPDLRGGLDEGSLPPEISRALEAAAAAGPEKKRKRPAK